MVLHLCIRLQDQSAAKLTGIERLLMCDTDYYYCSVVARDEFIARNRLHREVSYKSYSCLWLLSTQWNSMNYLYFISDLTPVQSSRQTVNCRGVCILAGFTHLQIRTLNCLKSGLSAGIFWKFSRKLGMYIFCDRRTFLFSLNLQCTCSRDNSIGFDFLSNNGNSWKVKTIKAYFVC